MYSRTIDKAPKHIVHNGKIHFGTFASPPARIDIRGVKAPFAGIPLPPLISNTRIKSRLSYVFSVGKYAGMVDFFDDKAFGLAEVIFWDTETKRRLAYHKFMGPRRRFVPLSTEEAACTSFGKTRYIRIAWSQKRKRLSLTFTVKGYPSRPAAKAVFVSAFDGRSGMLFVNPAPTAQRCSATWALPLSFSGGIAEGRHRHHITSLPIAEGLGIMLMNRTYLKPHSSSEMMFGLTRIDGTAIRFHFSNSDYDSVDADAYNDNFLSADADISAMPPVTITHPFGIEKKWIVQDTECMVDLTFMPVSLNKQILNIILMKKTYTTIYGTFDGALVTKDGKRFTLKNCPGIVRKNLLRL